MRQRTEKRLEIGVLHGFRALMVMLVANYHLWQQSWLPQYVNLFGQEISLDFFTRSSYVFVDGMIFLSGFLLYLPYARQTLEGTPVPTVRQFYRRRAERILPAYLLAVLVALFCIALPQNLYATRGAMLHDLAAHLTFTFLLWPQTYISTPLNVGLWTIAVEVQFYLLFPLLARAMQKRPVWTAGGMMAAGWLYRFLVARLASDTSMLINQLPAFLDVYALGFLGAMLYCRLRLWMQTARRTERALLQTVAAMLCVLGAFGVIRLLKIQSAASANGFDALRLSQMRIRLPLVLALGGMMLGAAFLPKPLQKPLGNRLMRFLSEISMNLYIWHQVLAVEMRKAWFPDTNLLHTDRNLQSAYMLLCASVALLVAMAVTAGLKPLTRLRRHGRRYGSLER